MSSTQLLVLGVVRKSRPVHGYDVRRTLLTWRADEWANINPGSIYHALKTLTRDGFLRVAGTTRQGSRPERTAYQLTADGETAFVTLLRESLWTVSSHALPLYAGLAFVTALRREEVLAVMRNRVAQVDAAMAVHQFVQTSDLDAGHPELLALKVALAEAEAALSRPSAGWTSRWHPVNWSAFWDPTAPARPPHCGCAPPCSPRPRAPPPWRAAICSPTRWGCGA